MAYVFKQIDDQLNSRDPQQITSTSSSIANTSGPKSSGFQNTSNVANVNSISGINSGFSQEAQQKANSLQEGIKSQAQAFSQKAPESFAKGQDLTEGLKSGDQQALTNAQRYLSGQAFADPQKFQGTVDERAFSDVGKFGSQEGRNALLKQKAGPQYTRGQSALDALLLQKDPTFSQTLGTSQKAQADIQSQKAAIEQQTNAQIAAQAKANNEAIQNKIREQAQTAANAIRSGAESRIGSDVAQRQNAYAQELARRNAELKNTAQRIAQQEQKSLEDKYNVTKEYGFGVVDKGYAMFDRNKLNQNVNDVIARYAAQATAPEMGGLDQSISQDEVNRFNAIQALLGGQALANAKTYMNPTLSYDKEALNRDIGNAVSGAGTFYTPSENMAKIFENPYIPKKTKSKSMVDKAIDTATGFLGLGG